MLVVVTREVGAGVERWPVRTELETMTDFIKMVQANKANAGLSLVGDLRRGRVPRKFANNVIDVVVRFDVWSHSGDGNRRRNWEDGICVSHDGLEDGTVLLN